MKINVTGAIGWDFTGETLREQLNGHTGDFEMSINSPGGDLYTGIELFNEIRRYQQDNNAKVTVYLTGFVGSAASYLSMAASERVAYDNSVFMIHNAAMGVFGDSEAFAYWADDLKRTDAIIARAYSKATGKPDAEIRALMSAGKDNDGTYFYGEEIKEAGFATRIIDSEDGGDKQNAVKEGKVLFANFKRNSKPTEYDHERIVALVNNSREAKNKIGEDKVTKEEIFKNLSVLKANMEITLPEIAKHLGLETLVISDIQKSNLAAYESVKLLAGESDPVEFITALLDERKANAASVREAQMSEAFGPVVNKETGKKNHAREFAAMLVGDADLTEEKVNEVKENETFKKLASDLANKDSDYNRIVEDEKPAEPTGPAVI